MHFAAPHPYVAFWVVGAFLLFIEPKAFFNFVFQLHVGCLCVFYTSCCCLILTCSIVLFWCFALYLSTDIVRRCTGCSESVPCLDLLTSGWFVQWSKLGLKHRSSVLVCLVANWICSVGVRLFWVLGLSFRWFGLFVLCSVALFSYFICPMSLKKIRICLMLQTEPHSKINSQFYKACLG